MKNCLVSDDDCNIVNLQSPPKNIRMTNNIGFAFSVSDIVLWFSISIEQNDQNW